MPTTQLAHRFGASRALASATLLVASPALAAPKHRKPAAHRLAAHRPFGHLAQVAPPPPGVERPAKEVFLSIGEGEIVNLPPGVANVWTSNPEVADVFVSSSHQIQLFGKVFGQSTVFATTASGAVVYAATLRVAQNSTSVDDMLHQAYPNDDIKVSLVGQIAVLTGTVSTPLESNEVEQLVAGALNPGIKTDGSVPLKIIVVNRLQTATPLQISLHVRIAEVARSLTRAIGANLTTYNAGGNIAFGLSRGSNQGTITNPQGIVTSQAATGTITRAPTVYGLASNLANSTAIGIGAKFLGLDILGSLDLGEQVGLVNTLAEPTLTALSGETASFLAGGEYPIPVSSGLGTVSIDYKDYGVSLSYTATVLANGNISMRVRPEVSELDTSNAVSLNGYSVPALKIRRAETTIELGSGQSFMIAGLLNNTSSNTIEKTPGAGDLPVIGALFKSTNFQKGETELVIVVTPYLVKPVNDGDIKLPTDGFQNPDDAKRLFRDFISDGISGEPGKRPGATAAPGDADPASPPASSGASGKTSQADGKPKQAADANAAPGFSLN